MIEDELEKVLNNKYTSDVLKKERLLYVLFLTQKHLKIHKLETTNVKFIHRKTALGVCYNNGEKIGIQLNHALNSSIIRIEQTIIHEIAHIIVGNEFSHRIEWQLKALELGLSMEHIKRYKL